MAGGGGGGGRNPRPLLRLGGDEALTAKLLPALAETHTRARSTLRFQVRRGDGDGIQSLLDGVLDLAATSHAHRPRDEEQAKERGFSLNAEGARHIIGVDVLAIAVHASNPTDSLTYDQVIGVFWGAWAAINQPRFREEMDMLFEFWRTGALKPLISEHFALEDAPSALARMRARGAIGKLVVTVSE